MLFKIGFVFLVPVDLALIQCWSNVETFLNDLIYGEPSSRVIPAYPQLFRNSVGKDNDNGRDRLCVKTSKISGRRKSKNTFQKTFYR